MPNLLSSVYTNYEWLPWKFIKTPDSYWLDINNQEKFMKSGGEKLNIKEISDWYKVTNKVAPAIYLLL